MDFKVPNLEKQLLLDLKPIFDFLDLPTIANILSLNKRMILATSEIPYTFLYVLKRFYLSKENLSRSHKKFFKILLKKRIRIDPNNLLPSEKIIYVASFERMVLNKNLISNDFKDQSKIRWQILQNGGDGWKLETVNSNIYKYCLANSFDLCKMSCKTKFSEFSPGFLSDFLANRVVLKAGCFIARRFDCHAIGGCMVIIKNHDKLILMKKINKTSEELPICSHSETNFTEISFKIISSEIPKEENIEDCVIELIIYGQDEQFWKGWYGTRFTGMYLRGDFENPLKIIE